jgi:endonuclease YncB( thermonuclease family)
MDLERTIVSAGWALAWYPERGAVLGPRFDEDEAAASAAGAGIWRGAFIPPWEWRRQR